MRQILCVRLLNWPIDCLCRRLREHETGPLAVVGKARNQRIIVGVNLAAKARGVARGMPLAQGRAICSELVHYDHDAGRDGKALGAVARWMMRFSPLVCADDGDHSIFLDVTGCERVFGGMGELLGRVAGTMRRWRVTARTAIAPTAGAAWALAQYGASNHTIISRPEDLEEVLWPLPVGALRIGGERAAALGELGIETVGQVMALPRSALPARFGNQLLLRLDQAMGRIGEPLDFLAYPAPVWAREDFEAAISSMEMIEAALRRVIGRIVNDLAKRGWGARRMEVVFFRPYAAPVRRTILLSRASRDGGKIFRLIQCAMEGMEGKFEIRNSKFESNSKFEIRGQRSYWLFPPAGFLGIGVKATLVEKISDEQLDLLEQRERAGQIELDDLVERLTLRLGPEGLMRPEMVESYVPEKAVINQNQKTPTLTLPRSTRGGGEKCVAEKPRPVQLLARPVEIGVIASAPPDGDGSPASFVCGGVNRRIVHAAGPERITGQWWEGPAKTRDYFDVEDSGGRRFWIFRVAETGRWFLQGQWG